MAISQDFFEGWLGEPFSIEVCLTDCDGNPLDLTGATVSWKIVDFYGGTTLLEIDTVNDPTKIAITDAINGVIEITIPDTDTTLINRNCSNFTIKVEFASGEIEILFQNWQLYLYTR